MDALLRVVVDAIKASNEIQESAIGLLLFGKRYLAADSRVREALTAFAIQAADDAIVSVCSKGIPYFPDKLEPKFVEAIRAEIPERMKLAVEDFLAKQARS